MKRLDGQVVLVTGANRGIGRAIAEHCAALGARVQVGARDGAKAGAVVASIVAAGGCADAVELDVSQEASVTAAFARIAAECGGLDALVNNAGIGRYGSVTECDLSDFDAVMRTNVRGAFACCREAMRLMVPRRSGTIINISSVVGFKGYPQQAAYTASKHAVMGLTKSLSVEAQEHDIRVSAVLPGGVDTDMVADARPDLDRSILIQPQDIADAVAYLLTLGPSVAIDQIYLRRRGAAPF